jgi:hypothetical protein
MPVTNDVIDCYEIQTSFHGYAIKREHTRFKMTSILDGVTDSYELLSLQFYI